MKIYFSGGLHPKGFCFNKKYDYEEANYILSAYAVANGGDGTGQT